MRENGTGGTCHRLNPSYIKYHKRIGKASAEMISIKEMREKTGFSQQKFGDYLNIPRRTIQDWELGNRKCPDYVAELIEYKLKNEGLI